MLATLFKYFSLHCHQFLRAYASSIVKKPLHLNYIILRSATSEMSKNRCNLFLISISVFPLFLLNPKSNSLIRARRETYVCTVAQTVRNPFFRLHIPNSALYLDYPIFIATRKLEIALIFMNTIFDQQKQLFDFPFLNITFFSLFTKSVL